MLPWQCLTRYSASCEGVKFIDIDFPDLMARKYSIIHDTSELNSLLTNMRVPDDPLVLLESDQYIQMGCDLRDLASIQQSLSRMIEISNCEFIFVAEVSITYMETKAADAVIKWAGSLGQGRTPNPFTLRGPRLNSFSQLSSACWSRYYQMVQLTLSPKQCCATSRN